MSIFKDSIQNEIRALSALAEGVDEAMWRRAAEMIRFSSLTVTSACGASGYAARKFAHALSCLECPAKFIAPSEAVHGGIGALRAGNVLVLVSKGGQTDELLPLARIARQKGAHIIAVTQEPTSPLARGADVILRLPAVPENDPYDMISTSSFTATTAIFHALMMEIMARKAYGPAEYAANHTGGAVGEKLRYR